MRKFSCASVSLLALLVAGSGGCGGGPPTQSVSGKITFKGQPVASAQVAFIPATGQEDVKPAHGQTDPDGCYTLRTYVKPGQEVSGAMVGTFQVTLTEVIAQNRIVEYDELSGQPVSFPPLYSNATTTPLSATVSADGDNVFDFTLEPTAP